MKAYGFIVPILVSIFLACIDRHIAGRTRMKWPP